MTGKRIMAVVLAVLLFLEGGGFKVLSACGIEEQAERNEKGEAEQEEMETGKTDGTGKENSEWNIPKEDAEEGEEETDERNGSRDREKTISGKESVGEERPDTDRERESGKNLQEGGNKEEGEEDREIRDGENPEEDGESRGGENPGEDGESRNAENPEEDRESQSGENLQEGAGSQSRENLQEGAGSQSGENPQEGGENRNVENPEKDEVKEKKNEENTIPEGENQEEQKADTGGETEEDDPEILFPEFQLRSVVNDSGNSVADAEGNYYFRKSVKITLQIGEAAEDEEGKNKEDRESDGNREEGESGGNKGNREEGEDGESEGNKGKGEDGKSEGNEEEGECRENEGNREEGEEGENKEDKDKDGDGKDDADGPAGRFVIRRDGETLTEEDGHFTDVTEEEGEYLYSIVYCIGEQETEGEQTLLVRGKKVTEAPSIFSRFAADPMEISEKQYIAEDPEIRLWADARAGILLTEYKEADGAYRLWKDLRREDACYLYGESASLEERLEEADEFAEQLTDMKDGSYHYSFRVTDVLGGTAETRLEFIVDKTAPDEQVFVSYTTDGTNPESVSHTGIMDFMRSAVNRLFGKKEICFELYAADGQASKERLSAGSGIDTEDLLKQIQTADGRAELRKLRVIEEGTASFQYDGRRYDGYTRIGGCIVLPSGSEQDMSDRLQIKRLKDRAGNLTWHTDTEDMTGATILYLDSQSPVLSVDYKDGILDAGKRTVFYSGETSLTLVLKEANYRNHVGADGEPVNPYVGITDTKDCGAVISGWRRSAFREDEVYAELIFPEMPGTGEAVYDFTAAYQDGAGNLLKTAKSVPGETRQGVYTGYTVVVDNRPPELTAFSVEGKLNGQYGGADVYQNREGEDIRCSFAIDDHAKYWNPEAVKLTIWNTYTKKAAAEVNGSSLQWNGNGRSHQTVYVFDGEEGMTAAVYNVTITYKDCAGNAMVGRGDLKDRVKNGIYTSREFLLDHKAPEFCMVFNDAVRLVKDNDTDPLQDRYGCGPQTGYTAYYDDTVEVCFSIQEQSAHPVFEDAELTGLQDFELTVTEKDTGSFRPDIDWKKTGNVYEGRFTLNEEGRYRISAVYRDMAGNAMVLEETCRNTEQTGMPEKEGYESVLLVLDRTAPTLQISYVDREYQKLQEEAVSDKGGCRYFPEPVYLKIEIKDEDLRFHEPLHELLGMRVSDRQGKELADNSACVFLEGLDRTKTAEEAIWYLPLLTEAVYEIPVGCTDLAGNRSEQILERVCVDQTDPRMELSYSVEKSGFLDAVRYRDIRYLFADSRMTIRTTAQDPVSGIRSICYRIEEESGRRTERKMELQPAASGEFVITIPADSADFKGTVTAEVRDWSGNCAVQTCGHIIESGEKHRQEGSIRIMTETSPSRTVGGVDYYNTDIRLKLIAEDTCSGLGNVVCRGGRTIDHHRVFSAEEGIVYEYQEELILDAAANNENDVMVQADYQDHAGHTGMTEQSYHIDRTVPTIEVEYDNTHRSDAGLYPQPRVATVKIRERNFDPADVEFQITNTDGVMPSIGDWQEAGSGDDTLHICHVNFFADGDYTFTLGFTDLAGNRAEYEGVDEFTIDQTEPVVTVHYDQESSSGIYYAQSRVAVIDILEHNFDASLIRIEIAEQNGADVPAGFGWHSEGDHHVTRIRFDADGDYTLGLTGTDQAGNQMNEYRTEHFIIDQTAPVLEISGIEDHSANKGSVMPVIRCTDANYQSGSLKIRLNGCQNGWTELNGTTVRSAEGEMFTAEDLVCMPEMDDLYQLSVSARDLAGNVSTEEICFSVNRFGSVYTLEDRTELLAGSRGIYYTNTEQDIIVTETNVDTLEFLEISCSRNGKLLTLEQGKDYLVQVNGTDESWKQYIYTIPGYHFAEEGMYLLTIYSEDRAENASDNQSKGKKIEFVMDKTAPSILLSGIEDGGQYRESSREITLDVQDNVRMSEVKVKINGIVSTYHASEVLEKDGRLTLSAGSADHWQTISVTAFDAAGNQKELEKRRFLLTPDLLIQFLMDRTLFGRTVCGFLLVWAGGWWLFFRRERARKCKRSAQ